MPYLFTCMNSEKGQEMATKMFVNIPVHDLKQSMEFFAKLGFTFNPHFTDDTAACMVVGEDSYVMLLTHDKFKIFTPKVICDATKSTEVLVALSAESRANVDDMVRKAVAAVARPTVHHRIMVYVWAWLSGSRWPPVGSVLHGSQRHPSGLKRASCHNRCP